MPEIKGTYCDEHKMTCQALKDAHRSIEDHEQNLRKAMTTRVGISMLTVVTTIFLGLFAISIDLNQAAIDEVNNQAEERKVMIRQLYELNSETKVSIAQLSTSMRRIDKSIDSMQGELRELHKPSRN